MSSRRFTAAIALSAVFTVARVATAQMSERQPTAPKGAKATATNSELPLKYTGKPTTPEISAGDLMTRLYIFADDSMGGREVGTEYNNKGTAYIEREVRRMGLKPAGDDGGYFQNLPIYALSIDPGTSLRIGDQQLVLGTDYVPLANAERRVSVDGVPVVYGGMINDSTTWLSAKDMAGKIVVLGFAATGSRSRVYLTNDSRFGRATAVFINDLDGIPTFFRPRLMSGTRLQRDNPPPPGPMVVDVASRVFTRLVGPADSLHAGAPGKPMTGTVIGRKELRPARNVVAILPGSDPQLKGQY
ncbi:MAG: hypothetical protein ABJE10_05285, partial [bacterium]